jgi:hypothetical protein
MTQCFAQGRTGTILTGLIARIPTALRQPLSSSGASNRHASAVSRLVCEMGDSGDAPDRQELLKQKVLRFCQKGRSSSPQLARINSGFLSGKPLAAKGDALIHGPCLVARPVGSEWRTRRPYKGIIQTN